MCPACGHIEGTSSREMSSASSQWIRRGRGKIVEEHMEGLPDPGIRLIKRVPIEKADVLVSGEGPREQEGFKLLEELARLLNGAVSGSRKAVDAGWIPHEKQVGQTGKTVKSTLYFAIGTAGLRNMYSGLGRRSAL